MKEKQFKSKTKRGKKIRGKKYVVFLLLKKRGAGNFACGVEFNISIQNNKYTWFIQVKETRKNIEKWERKTETGW
jgi:hypothetical protein